MSNEMVRNPASIYFTLVLLSICLSHHAEENLSSLTKSVQKETREERDQKVFIAELNFALISHSGNHIEFWCVYLDIMEQGCELWSVVCTRKELADQKICADFKKMELWICSDCKPSSRGSGEMWLVPSWRNPSTTTSFSLRPRITYLLETIF